MSEIDSKEKAPLKIAKDKLKIIHVLAIVVAVVTYFTTDIDFLNAIGLWFVALITIAGLYQLFGNRK